MVQGGHSNDEDTRCTLGCFSPCPSLQPPVVGVLRGPGSPGGWGRVRKELAAASCRQEHCIILWLQGSGGTPLPRAAGMCSTIHNFTSGADRASSSRGQGCQLLSCFRHAWESFVHGLPRSRPRVLMCSRVGARLAHHPSPFLQSPCSGCGGGGLNLQRHRTEHVLCPCAGM